jgi:hypothetical protein
MPFPVPSVSVSKKLLEKNGFDVTWTQSFLLIPTVTVGYTYDPKLQEAKELFPEGVETLREKVGFSLYAG